MKNDLYILLAGVILGIFIMFQFKSCDRKQFKVDTTIESKRTSDTVKVHIRDTMWLESKIKYVYLKPEPIIKVNDSINKYEYNILDSNLTGLFTSQVKGKILNTSFNYKIKYPKITQIDTIKIHTIDSITITNNIYKNKMKFLLGASMSFDSTFKQVGLNASLQLKNQSIIYYQYGLRFNGKNQHELGIKIPIKKKY